jgi:3-hexulose-6-phosphate synthase
MKLQLALDRLTREECFNILQETHAYTDWIEIGTGVIKEYGISIIREVKDGYPDKMIIADMKTCDAGKHEAIQAFKAGADITTVMAFSADKTITDTLEVAKQYNKQVMVDLLGVSNQQRLRELESLGVNLVSLHFGKDMQQEGEFQTNSFQLTKNIPLFKVAVAGGITTETLPGILTHRPEVIIVGSGITGAENTGEAAKKMLEVIRQYEINH